jgi:nicotinamidase-related amidase
MYDGGIHHLRYFGIGGIAMRKMLVVVDMQKDFVDGALGTAEALAIVPAVVEKIKNYSEDCIWATRDTHQSDYLSTQEGKQLPVEHCIAGTAGWQIYPDISNVLPKCVRIFDKPSFGSVELARALAEENAHEPIEVEFVGLCTDICVISNALIAKAFAPEMAVRVDPTCCAGTTPEGHMAALTAMRSCQVLGA